MIFDDFSDEFNRKREFMSPKKNQPIKTSLCQGKNKTLKNNNYINKSTFWLNHFLGAQQKETLNPVKPTDSPSHSGMVLQTWAPPHLDAFPSGHPWAHHRAAPHLGALTLHTLGEVRSVAERLSDEFHLPIIPESKS